MTDKYPKDYYQCGTLGCVGTNHRACNCPVDTGDYMGKISELVDYALREYRKDVHPDNLERCEEIDNSVVKSVEELEANYFLSLRLHSAATGSPKATSADPMHH